MKTKSIGRLHQHAAREGVPSTEATGADMDLYAEVEGVEESVQKRDRRRIFVRSGHAYSPLELGELITMREAEEGVTFEDRLPSAIRRAEKRSAREEPALQAARARQLAKEARQIRAIQVGVSARGRGRGRGRGMRMAPVSRADRADGEVVTPARMRDTERTDNENDFALREVTATHLLPTSARARRCRSPAATGISSDPTAESPPEPQRPRMQGLRQHLRVVRDEAFEFGSPGSQPSRVAQL